MKMFERIIFDVFLMILVEARVRIFMRNTCNFAFDSPNKLTKCFGCLFFANPLVLGVPTSFGSENTSKSQKNPWKCVYILAMLYSYVNLTISLEIVTFTECKLNRAFFRQIDRSFAFCSEIFSSNWL